MRTQDEIVERYEDVKGEDWLGVIAQDLVSFLDYVHAKPFLKPETTEADWEQQALTDDGVITRLRDYLPFAFEKAHDERGISAGRSIQHFQSWLWLLGDDDLLAFASDDSNYAPYGLPILRRIHDKYAPDMEESCAAS